MSTVRENKLDRSPVIEKFHAHVLQEFKKIVNKDTAKQITEFLIKKLDALEPTTDKDIITSTLKDIMDLVDDITVHLMLKKASNKPTSFGHLLEIQAELFQLRYGKSLEAEEAHLKSKVESLFKALRDLSKITELTASSVRDEANKIVETFLDSLKTIKIKEVKNSEKNNNIKDLIEIIQSVSQNIPADKMVAIIEQITKLESEKEVTEEEFVFISEDSRKILQNTLLSTTEVATVAKNIEKAIGMDLRILPHDEIISMWEESTPVSQNFNDRQALFAITDDEKPSVRTLPTLNIHTAMFSPSSIEDDDTPTRDNYYSKSQ